MATGAETMTGAGEGAGARAGGLPDVREGTRPGKREVVKASLTPSTDSDTDWEDMEAELGGPQPQPGPRRCWWVVQDRLIQ